MRDSQGEGESDPARVTAGAARFIHVRRRCMNLQIRFTSEFFYPKSDYTYTHTYTANGVLSGFIWMFSILWFVNAYGSEVKGTLMVVSSLRQFGSDMRQKALLSSFACCVLGQGTEWDCHYFWVVRLVAIGGSLTRRLQSHFAASWPRQS